MTLLVVTVYGKAQPAGSKQPFIPRRKGGAPVLRANGSIMVNTVDANPDSAAWKAQVAQTVASEYDGDLLVGPLDFVAVFFRAPNKGHFGTGKNEGIRKGSAPAYPDTRPDATKLIRGVEDALSGIVWRDDAQIVRQMVGKDFGTPERVEIIVRENPFRTVGDLVVAGLEAPPDVFGWAADLRAEVFGLDRPGHYPDGRPRGGSTRSASPSRGHDAAQAALDLEERTTG